MTKSETRQKLWEWKLAKNHSYETFKSYWAWLGKYIDFCIDRKDLKDRNSRVREFLTELADNNAAYNTQKQALNAIACLYNQLIGDEFDAGDFAKAKKPTTLPVCLSREEIGSLIHCMSGQTRLMAQLAYGSGMRLSELISLRVKDLDFDNHMIYVRQGKGAKDRTVPLPRSIAFDLRQQIEKASRLHQLDRSENAPGVYMPGRLAIKFPKASTSLAWFWIWPGAKPSRDPETEIVRRHHVHKNALQKAIARALPKARIFKKVTVHTLRHSFATHMLQHEQVDIHTLQRLMGHKNLSTTEVYLHCVPDVAGTTRNPLDNLAKMVPFHRPTSEPGYRSFAVQ